MSGTANKAIITNLHCTLFHSSDKLLAHLQDSPIYPSTRLNSEVVRLSNHGPAEWFPQRRTVKRAVSVISAVVTGEHSQAHPWGRLPEVCPSSTQRSRNLPWRRCAPQMCPLTPGSTKPSGPEEWRMSKSNCPENVMRMKIHQKSSTFWLTVTTFKILHIIDVDEN